uniref:DUF6783 domain-containing protein n=1 Tax=Blautia faecicola TaxID=2509240 RepID=UPI003520A899
MCNVRACLKNHSCNLHAPLCGIFYLHSVDVARYAALIQEKSPTNCDAHLAESLFQTRSSFIYEAKKILTASSTCSGDSICGRCFAFFIISDSIAGFIEVYNATLSLARGSESPCRI